MSTLNMFAPAFGGLPQVFFGRANEVSFIESAIENANSPHRAFFITGNRGCGKTTLLEKASRLAREHGWLTVDVHSSHASQSIIEALAGGTEKTTGKSLSPGAFGISVGSAASSTRTEFSQASLGQLLIDTCGSLIAHRGVFITVDEIQKVPEQDAENLCSAVQLALRKGLPIMLALAGLPGSKEKVASYPGCTFMQRTYDMKIGCMQVDETLDAFSFVFRKMPEYEVTDDALWEAGFFSQGYPYLMQLVGYYAVERASETLVAGSAAIDAVDIEAVEPVALEAYRENVLNPILSGLSTSLSSYLEAMCDAQDAEGRVSSRSVAELMGKKPSQVSSYRQRLIDRRLIEPDGYGYARFLLPHIESFYRSETAALDVKDPSQQWNRVLNDQSN